MIHENIDQFTANIQSFKEDLEDNKNKQKQQKKVKQHINNSLCFFGNKTLLGVSLVSLSGSLFLAYQAYKNDNELYRAIFSCSSCVLLCVALYIAIQLYHRKNTIVNEMESDQLESNVNASIG